MMKKNSSKNYSLFLSAIATGLFGFFATPAQGQDFFSNQSIEFAEDTVVEFEFIQSHGSYQATLGIKDETTGEETVLFRETQPYDDFGSFTTQRSSTGNNDLGTSTDFVGTVEGGTVQNRFSEQLFKADRKYSFFLESVSPSGQTRRTVVSTQNFARFNGGLDGGTVGNQTGTQLAWEDGGQVEVGNDSDFDDFVIEAGGYLIDIVCPPFE
ncbi:MAG: hypothetical protein WA865_21395 [Spirulinaceae cyanobacterium]